MFLTSLAVILFILTKVVDHYQRKYDKMDDGSRIAHFRWKYWRTSKAIGGIPFAGAMLCVWFETRNLPIAHIIAIMILVLCAFSAICGIMMCIVTAFEQFFGSWDLELHEIKWRFRQAKESISDWIQEWRKDAADMCWSYATNAATLALFGAMLTNMAITVIPDLWPARG